MSRSRSRALRTALLVASTLACRVASAADPPPAPPAQPAPPPPVPATVAPAQAQAQLPQSNTPVPPTPAEVQYRRMTVDVASTRPDAVLERRVNTKDENGLFLVLPWHSTEFTWEQVCVAPCKGVELDRYSTYRIAGANDVTSSKAFTLPQGNSSVHLQVNAGDRKAHHAGQFLAGVGMVAMIVGASLVVASGNIDDHHNEVRTRDAGLITAGSGLVVFGIGLPLALLTNTCILADDKPVRAASGPRFTGSGFLF